MGTELRGAERESSGVLQMVDRLEELVENATRIPLTGKVMVEARTFLDLLDQLRGMLPAEIGEARRLAREREKILAEAGRRAEEIREQARQEAERYLQETEIFKQASARAQELLRKAETAAQEIHHGAESYADELLGRLELTLEKALAGVKQGRQELKARRARTA